MYEELREKYIESASVAEQKQIKQIFRTAKETEDTSGKPMEEFGPNEWEEFFVGAGWVKKDKSDHMRGSIKQYARFLQENGVMMNTDDLSVTLALPNQGWAERFFRSFDDMERMLYSFPTRGEGRDQKAMVLALSAVGLTAAQIASLKREDVSDNVINLPDHSITDVERFIIDLIPLRPGILIQRQRHLATPVNVKTVQNIISDKTRHPLRVGIESLSPMNLARSYLFNKLKRYEYVSGELVENLRKKDWMYDQCRQWSGLVTNRSKFNRLTKDYILWKTCIEQIGQNG